MLNGRNDTKYKPNYWIVSSGDGKHRYSDIFLKYGIMAIGPGSYGDYSKNKKKYLEELDRRKEEGRVQTEWKNRGINAINSIKKFADNEKIRSNTKSGDIVVLREGHKKIVAVGKIVGNYEWNSLLGDVNGASIEHTRKVNWKKVRKKQGSQKFGIGYNFCKLSLDHKRRLKKMNINLNNISKKRKKKNILTKPKEYNQKDIKYIKSFKLKALHGRIKDYLNWKSEDYVVSEYDVTSFLVIPFLKKIGWDYNNVHLNDLVQNKAGNKHADIVLEDEKRKFCIIEVKNVEQGLTDEVRDQAYNYLNLFWKKKVKFKYFLITNGHQYKLYNRKRHKDALAYLDLKKPVDGKNSPMRFSRHPLSPKTKGAKEFLKKMVYK